MSVWSAKPLPIRDDWFKMGGNVSTEHLEKPGSLSFFNRHCQTRMRKVILFQKNDGVVEKVGVRSLICTVCEKRKVDYGHM
jgi:hypothetical protein